MLSQYGGLHFMKYPGWSLIFCIEKAKLFGSMGGVRE